MLDVSHACRAGAQTTDPSGEMILTLGIGGARLEVSGVAMPSVLASGSPPLPALAFRGAAVAADRAGSSRPHAFFTSVSAVTFTRSAIGTSALRLQTKVPASPPSQSYHCLAFSSGLQSGSCSLPVQFFAQLVKSSLVLSLHL